MPDSCTDIRLIDERAATRTALTATYFDPNENLVQFGSLTRVYSHPNIRGISIVTADPFQVDTDIDAPELRKFSLLGLRYADPYDTGTDLTERLTNAKWPKLEELELRLAETYMASVAYDSDAYAEVYTEERMDEYGDDEMDEGTDWNVELSPLLEAIHKLPLKRLALLGAASSDALLELLAETALPPTLEELDLSDTSLAPHDVDWFIKHKSVLEGLKRLVLLRVGIRDADAVKLEGLGPEIVHSHGNGRSHRFVVGSE